LNSDGQLGDGSNNDSNVPVNVDGISDAISISGGASHTCALLSSGAVKCWGDKGFPPCPLFSQRIESPGSHPANLTLKTLLKIANAFEVELAELFNFYDNEDK